MSRTNPYIFVLATSLLLGLAACSSRPYFSDIPEPVVAEPGQRGTASARHLGIYTVKSGDTLHSIAFAAGTDWSTLARLNDIRAPYTIYPGQQLRLGASHAATRDDTKAPARPAATIATAQRGTATASRGQRSPAPSSAIDSNPGTWRWPSSGQVLQGFGSGTRPNKGIDIAGAKGDPVLAARGGTVVYAGNGVRGYGNLLIVKHDAHWLSAYAHNSRLLVAEGDTVKAGQKIADMGDSGADRTKLHFEVRQQGNPIDPLRVLPKR